MTIAEYIASQPESRKELIQAIHDIIIKNDPNVVATVGSMMSKEMILYNQRNFFKYGLASVKEYMSLHVLPIYANAPLHAKYESLLPNARFQKGCINFKSVDEIPLEIVAQLMTDCASIDLLAIREKYLADKKKKKS
jgi:hypothetical protein